MRAETSYEVAKRTLCFKDRTTGISFCSLFLSGSKLTGHFVIIIIFSNSLRPYAIKIIEIIFVAERLERWDCTPEVPASSPTLTAGWIYFGSPEFQSSVTLDNRDLKQLRRRRQQQHQKTIGFMTKNNNSARASRFLVNFFDVHCTITTSNLPMRRYMEDVDIRRQIFLSLFQHG